MLSVLIPTYNYSAFELANEISQQCKKALIDYEIFVLDDASVDIITLENNEKINQLPNASFEKNSENLGRAGNINKLILKSKYDWVLLLDCDVKPVQKDFIQKYLNCIKDNQKITFGGIAYKDEKPEKEKLLRWFYGKKREEISFTERNKAPYKTTLTSNILIHKSIFESTKFNENIVEYGYEDLVFTEELKKNQFTVYHINNACYHLNYETSEIFLQKTETSLKNLIQLEHQDIINDDVTNLQSIYLKIEKKYLSFLLILFFNLFKNFLIYNIKSNKPSLFLLDLYKLGLYAKIKNHKE